jgi:translocation and assembly module TamA
MAEELTKLTQDLEKDQPLTGDSLALLQGAQARRAALPLRCARRAITTRASPPPSAASRSMTPPRSIAIEQRPEGDKITFTVNAATGPVYRVVDLEIRGRPTSSATPASIAASSPSGPASLPMPR